MDMISTIMSGKGKSRCCRSFWQKRSVIMEGIKAENCEKGKDVMILWDDVNLKTEHRPWSICRRLCEMQSSLIRKYSNTIRAPAICQAMSKSSQCALTCLFLAIILKRWGHCHYLHFIDVETRVWVAKQLLHTVRKGPSLPIPNW